MPHPTLAPGGGEPLAVEEIAVRANPAGAQLLNFPARHGRLAVRVTSVGPGHYDVATTSLGVFEVDVVRPFIGVPATTDPIRREMMTLGTPMALLIQSAGDLALHAAAVAVNGRAILITGPGGVGKSTLTAAALTQGWRVLADDLCRIQSEPFPLVFQGPVVARVREPAMDLLERSRIIELGRAAGKIHLLPQPFPHESTLSLPVGAIVFISRGSAGPAMTPVPVGEAIPELWRQSFFLPAEAARAKCFTSLVRLADSVPIWRLPYSHTQDQLAPTLERIRSSVEKRV